MQHLIDWLIAHAMKSCHSYVDDRLWEHSLYIEIRASCSKRFELMFIFENFQLWNKNGDSLSDSNLISKSKTASNFEIKANSWS